MSEQFGLTSQGPRGSSNWEWSVCARLEAGVRKGVSQSPWPASLRLDARPTSPRRARAQDEHQPSAGIPKARVGTGHGKPGIELSGASRAPPPTYRECRVSLRGHISGWTCPRTSANSPTRPPPRETVLGEGTVRVGVGPAGGTAGGGVSAVGSLGAPRCLAQARAVLFWIPRWDEESWGHVPGCHRPGTRGPVTASPHLPLLSGSWHPHRIARPSRPACWPPLCLAGSCPCGPLLTGTPSPSLPDCALHTPGPVTAGYHR